MIGAAGGVARDVEDEILLCAAHPRLAPDRRSRLGTLLATPPAWPRLLDRADRHALAPLLHAHVAALGPAAVPDAFRAALADTARGCVAWNLRLHGELLRLLGELGRAEIPVMPLKGAWLAETLWGGLALRPMSDIDVLVRPADLGRAERVLERAGGRRLPEAEQGAEYHVSYVMDGPPDRPVVELHRDLAEAHASRLDVRDVWAAADRRDWHGCQVWTMAPSDLLGYLCLHAVKDGLGSLGLLVDVGLAAERLEPAAWAELAERVRAARIRTAVYQALSLARELLGCPVPPAFLAAVHPPRGAGWTLAQALFRWRGGVLHVPPARLVGPTMALLLMLWEDAPAARLRHLRRNVRVLARRVRRRGRAGREATAASRG